MLLLTTTAARAVVVNSKMSRGKYLAREGPGSRLGGTLDQLFLWIFLWNFHRRCLSTFSIPWCKKVKNDQKPKSRGGPATLLWVGSHLYFQTLENETFQSVPELSGTSCTCISRQFWRQINLQYDQRRFLRSLLIQWSASAVCHSLSDISRLLVKKIHTKAVLCSDISIVSCWTTLWDVAT